MGITTDTYDAAGRVVLSRDASRISREKVEKALVNFRALSSKASHVQRREIPGQPLYKLPVRESNWKEIPSGGIYSLEITAGSPR